jgi:hypothetical protein
MSELQKTSFTIMSNPSLLLWNPILFLMRSMKRNWKWNLATEEVLLDIFSFLLDVFSCSLVALSLSHSDWDVSQACRGPYVQNSGDISKMTMATLGIELLCLLVLCYTSLAGKRGSTCRGHQRAWQQDRAVLQTSCCSNSDSVNTVHTGI